MSEPDLRRRTPEELHAPERILLCLHEECIGDFYYPLNPGEDQSCPVNGRHPVKVYKAERTIPEEDRMDLLERTCDRCAQRAADCTVIDDAYVCGDCRAEIAAEGAEVESLRQQLRGAVELVRELRQFVPFEKPEQGPLPDWIVSLRGSVDRFLAEEAEQ